MKTNTFKTAFDQGKVKEKDYFLVRYPNGMEALFRLFKTERGYVMWGPPTEGKVIFRSPKDNNNLSELADSQARKEYANDVFENVYACGLPHRLYDLHTYDIYDEMAKLNKMYDFSDASVPTYVLATQCMYSDCYDTYFSLFIVSEGKVRKTTLYTNKDLAFHDLQNVMKNICSYAVRPEAIPKPTMEFLEEGCDGSKENPWICLGSQDEEKILEHSEEIISIDKENLMFLIKEGHKLQERVGKWLAELEECAKNLK